MFSEYLLSNWGRDDRKYSKGGGGSGGGDGAGLGCIIVLACVLIMSLMHGNSVEKERRDWIENEKQKSVQRYNEDRERREQIIRQNENQFNNKK